MKELISPAQANALFGIAVPVLGLALLGALLAARKDRRLALLCGGPLLLAGLLWWVYSAITNALGLDTVLNLFVNFGLFLAIGVGLGLTWKRITPAENAPQPPVTGGQSPSNFPITGGQGAELGEGNT